MLQWEHSAICSTFIKLPFGIKTFVVFFLFLSGHLRQVLLGAQWLSGRVHDSRPRGPKLETHWPHCVVVLEEDTFILA